MPAVPDVPEPCPAGRQPLHLILMLNLKRNCTVLLLEWYEIHILPFFNFTNNFSIIISTCISRCECVKHKFVSLAVVEEVPIAFTLVKVIYLYSIDLHSNTELIYRSR